MEEIIINLYLKEKLSTIKGIGKKRAELFEKLNIYSIDDLINHFPRDYEDRRNIKKISELLPDESFSIKGMVSSKVKEYTTTNNLKILSFKIHDETGSINIVFFNKHFYKNTFLEGKEFIFYGNIKNSKKGLEIHNPVFDIDNENNNICRIVPIYSSTENLSQNLIRKTIEDIMPIINNFIEEYLPNDIIERNNLISLPDAYRQIHFPFSIEDKEAAKKRLIFDEIFILETSLFLIKNRKLENDGAISFEKSENIEKFISNLKFELTNAQKKVINEIILDMKKEITMNRLIQGDVGSGKTVVAAVAIINSYSNKYQSALMVPTEILARQHYKTLNELFKGFDINVGLLVSSVSKKEKEEMLEGLASGIIDIIVGTHAIIQKNVEFKSLGLVITDEQHRFGVKQRKSLSNKGINPDILVMTATPIPRTLSLIIFGDLDISIIDELPLGRQKIDTHIINDTKKDRLFEFIKKNIKEGRQVYYVLPLVEDSDVLDLNSVEDTYERFKNEIFRDLNIGIIHGKMKDIEKIDIMNKFINREIDILVSTTVIEVGLDVPNANIIVIEHSERFGLSQLHQLRGRVGRGAYKSFCILVSNSKSEKSKKRMEIIKNNTDGFKISNYDLENRGPGEFFGFRQHGLPEFKIANLANDIEILELARKEAEKIIFKENKFFLKQESPLRKKIDAFIKTITEVVELN